MGPIGFVVALLAATAAQEAPEPEPQPDPEAVPTGPFLRYHHARIDGLYQSEEGPVQGTNLRLEKDFDFDDDRDAIWQLGYRSVGRTHGDRPVYHEFEVSYLWTDASRDATLARDESYNNVPFPAGSRVRSRFQLHRLETTGGFGLMDAITGFRDPGPRLLDFGISFQFGLEWNRFEIESPTTRDRTDEGLFYPTAGFGAFALLQPFEPLRLKARAIAAADARAIFLVAASTRHYLVDASLVATLEIADTAVLEAGFRFMVGDYPIHGDGLHYDEDEDLRFRYSIAAPFAGLTIAF